MKNSERIKNLRTSLNMSRAKFSEHFGIPARTIDDWENERREPSDYVVDMLIKLAASENTIPTTWARVEWRDGYGDGSTKYFLDRDEAIHESETEWNRMSEHDKNRRDAFFVGFYEMTWDDIDEKYITTGDPIVVAWDALKK